MSYLRKSSSKRGLSGIIDTILRVLSFPHPPRGMVEYATREADRLGLELSIHNCAGWSVSGGPWITPELSMQKIVWSETFVEGPKRMDAVLPQPETVADFYRDVAVLAFPAPEGENVLRRCQSYYFSICGIGDK